MSEHSLDRLFVRLGERRLVQGGEFAFRAGEVSGDLIRIESGRLAAVETGHEGLRLLETFHPGAIIGGREVLTGARHRRSYLALRDTEVSQIPKRRSGPCSAAGRSRWSSWPVSL